MKMKRNDNDRNNETKERKTKQNESNNRIVENEYINEQKMVNKRYE